MSSSINQSTSGFPAGQPLGISLTIVSHGANSRCRLTADQKFVLVRLCTQQGQEYLGSRDALRLRRTLEFKEIMKTKIQGARSIVDTLMKKYKQNIATVSRDDSDSVGSDRPTENC